jgi:hypothetical protein
MDQPLKQSLETLVRSTLRSAVRSAAAEVRNAAWRITLSVASAVALGLLLFTTAVAAAIIGVQHVALGLHGSLRALLGDGWMTDLLAGAVLLLLPAIFAFIAARRRVDPQEPRGP